MRQEVSTAWSSVVPLYLELLETGDEQQKQLARTEIMRLAQGMDESFVLHAESQYVISCAEVELKRLQQELLCARS